MKMKMKKIIIICAVIVSFLGLAHGNAHGALPANFPGITTHIYDANAIADGYVFLSVSKDVAGVGYYVMILENDGTVVWYKELMDDYSYDFNVQQNGYLHYAHLFHHHTYAGGGDVVHEILDENYNEVESIQMGNGHLAEAHDFQMLPNGNVQLFGYYLHEVDLSKLVPDGYPNALVSGTIVQELDTQRNVIFQWRSWDYYTFEDFFSTLTNDPRVKKPAINTFHINAMKLDTDGNIFVMTPQPASRLPRSGWVKKINRQTGEVMWTLGGDDNEFTFIGVDPNEGPNHFTGHGIYRLANGNVMNYDNGKYNIRSSQVHEYKLDEQNKIAEHVWTYVPDTMVFGTGRGNVQRLPNGNTLIGWGNVRGTYKPTATEVTPDGEKVWELFFDNPRVGSYRAFRFVYPPQLQAIKYTEYELAAGNTYVFDDTGVTIEVIDLTNNASNEVKVTREPYAPVYPEFAGKAPRALDVRVKVDQLNITSMTAEISFDAESFGFANSTGQFSYADPDTLTINYRPVPGQGLFIPLPTSYNPVTKQLSTTMTEFGEFIFCFPDLEEVPYAPMLMESESYRGVQEYMVIAAKLAEPGQQYPVNQELPILISWSPRGFARSYQLQVATDADFTALVVDESQMTEAQYVFETAEPGTTYYYRVNTTNYGGTSDWSVGSFQTVPPMVIVTSPNGGEQWQRGLDFFIKWYDNIAEDVVLELYKDDTLVETIGTVLSDRAYEWEVDLDLEPGCDYSIKVKSSENEALFDMSDDTFAIDPPDTTPPEFELSVTPAILWPPTHKMVLITPSWTVSDDSDPSPDVSLVSIVANEGDDTIGDGHTGNDIKIGEDGSIYLRSERSGIGTDRVYTITYEAVDDCGNVAVSSATVSIPHDFRFLARIAARWLWSGAGRIPEDLSGDGAVNLKDIAVFGNNWIQ
ncbi:MAG: aryl-sulfate sulfotransferase [Planctomycetota bacterium]|jgi:hypothetical protein